MDHSFQQIIHIGGEKDALSKPQKEFNRLTEKIQLLEAELVSYRAAATRTRQRIQLELVPLQQEYDQQRAALVRLFDRAYDSDAFKANDRKKLADLILSLSYNLIAEQGFDELTSIYDKYDPAGFRAASAEANESAAESLKETLETLYGIEFGDDVDVSSPEQMRAYVAEKLREQKEVYEEWQRQTKEQRASKPKTKKQQERAAKTQLQIQNSTKAVRSVYMDLVKAFHPDREPDEAEKGRKTEIMHRVTEAYEKGDLMALLQLQMEFNRIDKKHLERLAEEQLKHYNKILKQQVQELEQQLKSLQNDLVAMIGQGVQLQSAAVLERSFDSEVHTLKQAIKDLKKDLRALNDLGTLKQWLKAYRI